MVKEGISYSEHVRRRLASVSYIGELEVGGVNEIFRRSEEEEEEEDLA